MSATATTMPASAVPQGRAPIDHLAIGRLLTLAERGGEAAIAVDRIVTPLAGRAHVVGITGPPGAGKSTLVAALIECCRARDLQVGVIAVDPSSHRGGAVLGDRVRMSGHHHDRGVFVRSMASRGQLGGISNASPRAVRILDAAGFDFVFVETVGVGQLEIDIARHSDTTVVVLTPQSGDEVQAIKAGLFEIGDVFVVNKCDLAGAAATVSQVRMRLHTDPSMGAWMPPIVRTQASSGAGSSDLLTAIDDHRAHVGHDGALERRRAERRESEVRTAAAGELLALLDAAARRLADRADVSVDDLLDGVRKDLDAR